MIFIGTAALLLAWIASYFVPPRRYRLLASVLLGCLLASFASDVPGLQALAWVQLAYGLPMLIALFRKLRNAPAILAINVLLGWTLVGWVVALVWASTRDAEAPPAAQPAQPVH